MGQRAKWALPEIVDPANRRCFLIQVPDEPAHIAAFRGAIYELAKAYAWGDDTGHTALDVAAVWSDIYDAVQEVDCDMLHLVQFRQTDCGLEASYDGGETYELIYDATDCVNGLIQDGIDDGLLQRAGGQPGPSDPPLASECQSYHVILRANDAWKIPSPVSEGTTIHITNEKGGWTDGNVIWFCPNGDRYVAGACADIQLFYPSDPMPDNPHMQVIGAYDTTTPVYFDPLSQTFVIPEDVSEQEAWLQTNDSSLGDNAGQIEFDVEICSGGWTHIFDFTVDDGDFLPSTDINTQVPVPTWVTGEGWKPNEQTAAPHYYWGFIARSFSTSTRITYMKATFDYLRDPKTNVDDTYAGTYIDQWSNNHGNKVKNPPAGVLNVTYYPNLDTTRVAVHMSGDNGSALGYIRKLVVSGMGTDPFV